VTVRQPDVLSRIESAGGIDAYLARRRRSSWRVAVIVACLLFALAIACLLGGLHEEDLAKPIPGGTTTTGHVVSFDSAGCRGGCEWQIIVAFHVPHRGTITIHPPNATIAPYVGQSVRVSYLPTDPQGAHDLSDTNNDGRLLLILAAPLCAGLGIFIGGELLLTNRRQAKTLHQDEAATGRVFTDPKGGSATGTRTTSTEPTRGLATMGRLWIALVLIAIVIVGLLLLTSGIARYLVFVGFVALVVLRSRWDRLSASYIRAMHAANEHPARGWALIALSLRRAVGR
jgi:hypothetical protein